MPEFEGGYGGRGEGPREFRTTQWGLVADAGRESEGTARAALEALCWAYWYPLYAFIRRQGASPPDAEDLTQGFLGWLVSSEHLRMADPGRGRFRSFLLVRLKHYLSDDRKRRGAQKRGGGQAGLSLDEQDAEGRYLLEVGQETDPGRAFDRGWALTCLERAVSRLRAEYEAAGRADLFDGLCEYRLGEPSGLAYHRVAGRLGLSESAVKSAVFRLRRRQAGLLREEVAQTVAAGDVDAELRYLVELLGG